MCTYVYTAVLKQSCSREGLKSDFMEVLQALEHGTPPKAIRKSFGRNGRNITAQPESPLAGKLHESLWFRQGPVGRQAP